MKSKHTFFKKNYILSIITEKNKLNQDIRNAESYSVFRKYLLSFVRSEANIISNVHNTKGINFLTGLRTGLST